MERIKCVSCGEFFDEEDLSNSGTGWICEGCEDD